MAASTAIFLGKDGDRINAILAGAGHNLRLVLA